MTIGNSKEDINPSDSRRFEFVEKKRFFGLFGKETRLQVKSTEGTKKLFDIRVEKGKNSRLKSDTKWKEVKVNEETVYVNINSLAKATLRPSEELRKSEDLIDEIVSAQDVESYVRSLELQPKFKQEIRRIKWGQILLNRAFQKKGSAKDLAKSLWLNEKSSSSSWINSKNSNFFKIGIEQERKKIGNPQTAQDLYRLKLLNVLDSDDEGQSLDELKHAHNLYHAGALQSLSEVDEAFLKDHPLKIILGEKAKVSEVIDLAFLIEEVRSEAHNQDYFEGTFGDKSFVVLNQKDIYVKNPRFESKNSVELIDVNTAEKYTLINKSLPVEVAIQKKRGIAQPIKKITKSDSTHALLLKEYNKGSLKSNLSSLNTAQKVDVANDILHGVKTLHEAGHVLFHIEPNHILLDADSKNPNLIHADIADFNFIQKKESLSDVSEEVENQGYLPLEYSYKNFSENPEKSDVYQLAITLWAIEEGVVPSWTDLPVLSRKDEIIKFQNTHKNSTPKTSYDRYKQLLLRAFNDQPKDRPTLKEIMDAHREYRIDFLVGGILKQAQDKEIFETKIDDKRVTVLGAKDIYLEVSPIGKGTEKVVTAAEHIITKKRVALLKTNLKKVAKEAAAFEVEALKILKGKKGVVQFISVKTVKNVQVLVLELSTKGDLKSNLKKLTPEEKKQAADDIIDGLIATHAAGIIHSDLKPENILLNEKGAAITDFGVSFRRDDEHAVMHFGTKAYMSPNHRFGPKTGIDFEKEEVFELALNLWQMENGIEDFPPWIDATNKEEMIKGINKFVNEAKGTIEPDDPRGEYKLKLLEAMNVDPEKRPTLEVLKEANLK